jgi:hypothetical protein
MATKYLKSTLVQAIGAGTLVIGGTIGVSHC